MLNGYGKQTAHEIVYERSMRAFEAGRPLKEVLLEDERLREQMSPDEVEALFDYRQHTGLCGKFVNRVVAMTRREREEGKTPLKKGALRPVLGPIFRTRGRVLELFQWSRERERYA